MTEELQAAQAEQKAKLTPIQEQLEAGKTLDDFLI